jgi:hypothetical protein
MVGGLDRPGRDKCQKVGIEGSGRVHDAYNLIESECCHIELGEYTSTQSSIASSVQRIHLE